MRVTEMTDAELIQAIDDWFRDEIWAFSGDFIAECVKEFDKRRK